MARAGINKAVVNAARQSVMARGDNPTIDAVRIEMGNTGSKTTIHRFLKELEARHPAGAPATHSISDELTRLVSQLAERLQEEGTAQVAQAKTVFDEGLAVAGAATAALEQQLAELLQAHEVQAKALQGQTTELLACQTMLQAELTCSARLDQACGDLQVRLKDKEEHIASLEEKHRHARDALDHYRQSVKEQREQELRRHEAQLQAVQIENRQLQQSLQVKLQEATMLNRDNERLLVENRQAAGAQESLHGQIAQQSAQLSAAGQSLAKVEGGRDELLRQLGDIRGRLDEAQAREHGHRRAIDQLGGQVVHAQAERDAALQALAQATEKGDVERVAP